MTPTSRNRGETWGTRHTWRKGGVYIKVRTILKIAVACGSVFVVLALFVVGNTIVSRRRTVALVRDLQTFSTAEDFMPIFGSFSKRYGKSLRRLEPCTPAYCAYEIRISNRPIPFFYRVPYTELGALFQVLDNTTVLVLVDFRTAHLNGTSPIVHVQMNPCSAGCEREFNLNPHGESTELWNGLIEFNGKATAKERQAALSLNLDCFTKISGCDDISQMLPLVWKRSGSQNIVSRLPSMSDASWDRPQD